MLICVCRGCHETYSSQLESSLCCMFDPCERMVDGKGKGLREANTWCRWCGEELASDRSFCDRACSVSYHADVTVWRWTPSIVGGAP